MARSSSRDLLLARVFAAVRPEAQQDAAGPQIDDLTPEQALSLARIRAPLGTEVTAGVLR